MSQKCKKAVFMCLALQMLIQVTLVQCEPEPKPKKGILGALAGSLAGAAVGSYIASKNNPSEKHVYHYVNDQPVVAAPPGQPGPVVVQQPAVPVYVQQQPVAPVYSQPQPAAPVYNQPQPVAPMYNQPQPAAIPAVSPVQPVHNQLPVMPDSPIAPTYTPQQTVLLPTEAAPMVTQLYAANSVPVNSTLYPGNQTSPVPSIVHACNQSNPVFPIIPGVNQSFPETVTAPMGNLTLSPLDPVIPGINQSYPVSSTTATVNQSLPMSTTTVPPSVTSNDVYYPILPITMPPFVGNTINKYPVNAVPVMVNQQQPVPSGPVPMTPIVGQSPPVGPPQVYIVSQKTGYYGKGNSADTLLRSGSLVIIISVLVYIL